jgi:hypothetical protein
VREKAWQEGHRKSSHKLDNHRCVRAAQAGAPCDPLGGTSGCETGADCALLVENDDRHDDGDDGDLAPISHRPILESPELLAALFLLDCWLSCVSPVLSTDFLQLAGLSLAIAARPVMHIMIYFDALIPARAFRSIHELFGDAPPTLPVAGVEDPAQQMARSAAWSSAAGRNRRAASSEPAC